MHFSPSVCFCQLPSSVGVQIINSEFLRYFSNLRFCGFGVFFSRHTFLVQTWSSVMQHCRPWDSALLIQITQLNYLVSKPTCEFKYIHQSSFFMPFLAFILILTRFCLLYEQCDRFINYVLYPSVVILLHTLTLILFY